MDRSFLSQPEVITASRQFVCVRLTTYEDKEEGNFLRSFQVTRSGEVENTLFTILSSDGKRQLARASRSARHNFGDAAHLAATMKRIAREHPGKAPANGQPLELPAVPNVRLAVNVAACDNQPLVLLYAPEARVRKELEAQLSALAWSEAFRGRFVYVVASRAKELSAIPGARAEPGVLVVQSDKFGLHGQILKQIPAAASRAELTKGLQEGLVLHRRQAKSFRNHVRAGHQSGIFWETVLPVTDPMELQARERGRLRKKSP